MNNEKLHPCRHRLCPHRRNPGPDSAVHPASRGRGAVRTSQKQRRSERDHRRDALLVSGFSEELQSAKKNYDGAENSLPDERIGGMTPEQIAAAAKEEATCRKCGRGAEWKVRQLHVHHKKWVSDGGGYGPLNLVLLCDECHSEEHSGD